MFAWFIFVIVLPLYALPLEIYELQQQRRNFTHTSTMWQYKSQADKLATAMTPGESLRWDAFVKEYRASYEAEATLSFAKPAVPVAAEKTLLELSDTMVYIFCSLFLLVGWLFLYPGQQMENVKLQRLLSKQRQQLWEQLSQQDQKLNRLQFGQQLEAQRHINLLEHVAQELNAPQPNIQRLQDEVTSQLGRLEMLPGPEFR